MTVNTNSQDIQTENKTEQTKVEQPIVQAASIPATEETKEDRNWKKFREEREKERKQLVEEKRRREEAEKQAAAMKSMVEAITNKPAVDTSYSEEDSEDDRVKKLVAQELQRLESRRAEEQRIREQSELPHKLAQTYPNFNEVCSDENLDYIQYHYPEIYNTFKASPDSFDKWGNVYKAVKRLVPNPNSAKDEKRIEQNLKKPQSISLPGIASTSESMPHKIDEKRRADNWARMQRVLKNVK